MPPNKENQDILGPETLVKEQLTKKVITREDFNIPYLPDHDFYEKINQACQNQIKENSPEISRLINKIRKDWLIAFNEYRNNKVLDNLEDVYYNLKFNIDERMGSLQLKIGEYNSKLSKNDFYLKSSWNTFVDENWKIAIAIEQAKKDLSSLNNLLQELTKKLKKL